MKRRQLIFIFILLIVGSLFTSLLASGYGLPLPSNCKIEGFISGVEQDTVVMVTAISNQFQEPRYSQRIGNGEYTIDVCAGQVLVYVEAPGYTSNPDSYEIEVGDRQMISNLDLSSPRQPPQKP